MRKALGFFITAFHTVSAAVLWIVIILGAFLTVCRIAGYRMYIVETGSMSPSIPMGSVCIVDLNSDYSSVSVGDVISFRIGDGASVTHRAVEISPDGITTRGDANISDDTSLVTPDDFIGKTVLGIPSAGFAVLYLKSARGKILVAACAAIILIGSFIPDISSKKEHKNKKE